MRVLITGGFGYLGGRLALCFANHPKYETVLGSRQKRTAPLWLPKAEVVQTEWDSPDRLQQICDSVEVIVHSAGMNAQDCSSDPVAALQFNGVATARLLQAAIRAGVKRFIYLSTAHVYGSPLRGIITEETCPASLHPYATSHRAGEDVIGAASLAGEIEGIVIRLSNSYGVPACKNANCWMLLVNDLCRQVVLTRRIVLRSSGLQRRDFVPLADVSRAMVHFVEMPTKDHARDLFNLGGGFALSVREMASLIQERCEFVFGFKPECVCPEPKPDEVSDKLDFRIDALQESGFRPGADRTGEIDRMLEFCKAQQL